MIKKYIYNIALCLTLVTTAGCKDFLEEYSNDLTRAKSLEHLNETLIGDVYLESQMFNDKALGMGPGTYGFVNMLDDDINTTGTSLKGNVGNVAWQKVLQPMFGYFTWQQDVRYNYGKTNKIEDNQTWITLYRVINHANNIISLVDQMPRNGEDDEALRHRVKGEAFFLRGQFYLGLANLYGKVYRPDSASIDLCVPLKLTPYVQHEKNKDTQFQRNSVSEVFNQICSDLETAVAELTISPQLNNRRLHRASAEAAGLLLSRVYLYMQEWEKAKNVAKKVLESPFVMLSTLSEFDKKNPFLTKECREVLFSQGTNYIAAGNKKTSLSAEPADFCVTRDLYDLYSEEDVRKQVFFVINTGTDSVALRAKYERGLERNHISDHFLLRSAEAYLNYAEACAMLNEESEANDALNKLRKQRIQNYVEETYTGAQLVEEIRLERRRELCFEGHRWFDLRRYAENKVYPFAKEIVHVYNAYTPENAFSATHYYKLNIGDLAYTFSLPVKALESDKVPMINNLREEREEMKILVIPTIPGDEDEVEEGEEPSENVVETE